MSWFALNLLGAVHPKLGTHPDIANALLPGMVSGVAAFAITMFAGPYFIQLMSDSISASGFGRSCPSTAARRGRRRWAGSYSRCLSSSLPSASICSAVLQCFFRSPSCSLCSVLGYVDDRLTTIRIGGQGLRARFKFAWLVVIAIAIVIILHIPRHGCSV